MYQSDISTMYTMFTTCLWKSAFISWGGGGDVTEMAAKLETTDISNEM